MKLLLAEDDTILADALTVSLKAGVLDLGLPLVDGLTVL